MPTIRACEICGADYHYTHFAQRTCGRACGVLLKQCVTGTMTVRSIRLTEPHVRYVGPCTAQGCTNQATITDLCRPHYRAKRMGLDYIRGDVVTAYCATCTVEFRYTVTSNRRSTCDACKRAMRKMHEKKRRRTTGEHHRDRAKRYGVAYQPINVRTIYERDHWVCQLCGDPVDPTLTSPDQMAASLDHVVPMSKGGPHAPDNVQCAHWLCNSLKGADETLNFLLTSS